MNRNLLKLVRVTQKTSRPAPFFGWQIDSSSTDPYFNFYNILLHLHLLVRLYSTLKFLAKCDNFWKATIHSSACHYLFHQPNVATAPIVHRVTGIFYYHKYLVPRSTATCTLPILLDYIRWGGFYFLDFAYNVAICTSYTLHKPNLASFPGPRPASRRFTVLQVMGSWARAWERG